MARTPKSVMAAAALAAVFAAPIESAGAQDQPGTMVLHLDDHAHVDPNEMASARLETNRIFAASGVRAIWVDRGVDPQAHQDGLLHLTLVILGGPGGQRADVQRGDLTVLGEAAREAGRAYIHLDRVVSVAHQFARHVGVVLGMVMAHEVGHLVLPARGHSVGGIMRADLFLASMLPQQFTPRQTADIRAALAREERVTLSLAATVAMRHPATHPDELTAAVDWSASTTRHEDDCEEAPKSLRRIQGQVRRFARDDLVGAAACEARED